MIPASKNFQSTNTFIHGISEIRPYLYLCGYHAISREKLKALQITHIIDASNMLHALSIPDIQYLYIKVNDDDISDIKKHFVETSTFIQAAKDAGGKILVHCAAGISRSATLCIMHLVIHENLSLRKAYYEVRRARDGISPNLAFWGQMIEYETEKRGGKASVKFITKHQISFPDVYVNNQRKRKFCCLI